MAAHLVLRVDGPFPRLVSRDETGFWRVRCVLVIAVPPGGPPLPVAAALAQGWSTRMVHPALGTLPPHGRARLARGQVSPGPASHWALAEPAVLAWPGTWGQTPWDCGLSRGGGRCSQPVDCCELRGRRRRVTPG